MKPMITEHAEFYRATNAEGEERYFPVGGQNVREAAINFDATSNPVRMMGFAVYDVEITTNYAIGLYGSKQEAEASIPTKNPPPPVAQTDENDDDSGDALPNPSSLLGSLGKGSKRRSRGK